jgi:putative Holliday junction resolvase
MGRIVGIDFGLARIGVSLSDSRKILATSLGRITVKGQISEAITELHQLLSPYKDEIELIVVGNPLHLNGGASPMSQAASQFKECIEKELPYKVTLWDERLTSSQAEKLLKERALCRKKRAKLIDTVSAMIILQSYLDAIPIASNP